MYPIIFEHSGIVISSYGFMLMIAFIVCNYLIKRYLKSIGVNPTIGDDIIFYAAIGGIIGAKLYYIIEYFPKNSDGISLGMQILRFQILLKASVSLVQV